MLPFLQPFGRALTGLSGLSALVGGGASPSVEIPPALAYYTCDSGDFDFINDDAGNGVYLNSPSEDLEYTSPGKLGLYALSAGSASNDAFPLTGTTWTVSAWMRTKLGTDTVPVGSVFNGNIPLMGFRTTDTPNTGYFAFTDTVITTDSVDDDEWHHLAVSASAGDNTMRVYFDGVHLAEVVPDAASNEFGGAFEVRSTDNGDSSPIDEVGVWDVALSAEQIAALAAGSRPTYVPAP